MQTQNADAKRVSQKDIESLYAAYSKHAFEQSAVLKEARHTVDMVHDNFLQQCATKANLEILHQIMQHTPKASVRSMQ
jgi:hypothetical protein